MTISDHENRFRAVFDQLAEIPDSEWRHFWSHLQKRQYAAREYLIREAQPAETRGRFNILSDGLRSAMDNKGS